MKHLSSMMVRTVIALLCIMLASLALVITSGTQAVTQNQYEANIAQKEENIASLASLLDSDFYDYFTLASQISMLPDLRPVNLREDDPVSQIKARELLEAFKGANRRIIDICLYMQQEDYFITSVATFQPASFIESYYTFGKIDRARVYELFRGTSALLAQGQSFPYFLPVGTVNTSSNDTSVSDALLILMPISQWSSKPYATVGVLVQTNDISEQLSIVAEGGAARVTDKNGDTLVSVGENNLESGFEASDSVRVFSSSSARFGLIYEAFIEESSLYHMHFVSTRLIMTLIFLCMLVSFACLIFARWVNRPIRSLITHMGANSRLVDESTYIREYIYQLGKNVEQNEKYVSELLIRRLLAGQPLDEEELARCEALLKGDYAHCTVAAVRLKNKPENVLPLTTRVREHALMNVLQEAQLETLICIIASDETDGELLRLAQSMLSDPLLRDAQIMTIGPVEDEPLRLRDSMLRAMSRMKEMMYQGRTGVEMANSQSDRKNSYPSDAMHHLKAALQSKDAQALTRCCEELCELLLDARMNPETAAIVAYDLANLFPELSDSVSCSAQEFCQRLRECVAEACASFAAKPLLTEPDAADADGVRREIDRYIEENLEEPGFGISAISECYGMSDSAFSHMFKRTFGVTFIACVNQKKIQRAKQLLLETNFSLDVIALRLGYSSASNFTRMFKKYEDITPGAYRQLSRSGMKDASEE